MERLLKDAEELDWLQGGIRGAVCAVKSSAIQ